MTQNHAWDDHEHTDEILINCWHKFFQTPYGQSNAPDLFDKLTTVIQSQGPEDEPSEEQEVTREEWMILSDLNTPFDNDIILINSCVNQRVQGMTPEQVQFRGRLFERWISHYLPDKSLSDG